MCGRYRLARAERFAEFSQVRLSFRVLPRYNVAPTQTMPVVLDESPDELTAVRWGLVPSWAKDTKIGASLINARQETVASKPSFRTAYKKRRCLVPADGFYEWQKSGVTKIPQHISMRDGEPFAFAGLWENWWDSAAPEAPPLRTFTIITGEPNELVAPIHNRMPVILARTDYAAWLSPDTSTEIRASLLQTFPAELMQAYPISSRVNSPRNDDAALLEPQPSAPAPASDLLLPLDDDQGAGSRNPA